MRSATREIKARAVAWVLLVVVSWQLTPLSAGAAPAALGAEPTRTQLRQWFAELRAGGTVDIGAPLVWEYRFSAADSRKLEELSQQLVGSGYRIVALLRGPAGLAELRVAKVELHTPLTLERRGTELRALARAQGAASYDGANVQVPAGAQ